MNKAKTKNRRTAVKRGAGKSGRKAKDAAELRRQIETLVKQQAMQLVKSAIDEADKGHFAAMKYLFEMIGLYPGPGDGEEVPQETNSLARTLLRRLGDVEGEGAEDGAGVVPNAKTLEIDETATDNRPQ